jgi:F-type H+-transporting ATPase subunit a
MEHVHELWITKLFNEYLAGPANSLLNAIGLPSHNPAHVWTDWLACEVLVFLFILVFFAIARSQFSVEKPGKLQHTLEVVYEFLHAQAEEAVGHDGPKHLAFFGTLFFFILFMNLIGLIPGFDSPTMFTMVPAGLAVVTFIFYNVAGIKANGLGGYLKHFVGPMLLMAPLMIPIEIISQFARPLSLTIRLYANMFAGEQVYLTFITLTKLVIPAIFIGLHLFVSFLQAYIFTLLAMIYVGQAVQHEH